MIAVFSAFWIVFAIGLPGAAWVWALPPRQTGPRDNTLAPLVFTLARALAIGLPVALLAAWIQFEFGVGSRALGRILPAVISAAGIATGLARSSAEARAAWRASIPGLIVLWLLITVLLALPRRSEWIVGGWDPGIYTSQGMAVARDGTFHPPPVPAYASLGAEGLKPFLRMWEEPRDYVESFPGVPVDPATGALRHYFFRLMPTTVALFAQQGGDVAAFNVNRILGALTVVLLFGLLLALSASCAQACFAVAILVSQPIWLHHTHLPTTEMLQLGLTLGAALLLAMPRGAGRLVALAAILFVGVLNRIDFGLIAMLFLLADAAADLLLEQRGGARVRLVLLAAIALGLGVDTSVSAVTLLRLGREMHMIVAGSGALAIVLLIVEASAIWPWLRGQLRRLLPWAPLAAHVAVISVIALGLTNLGLKTGMHNSRPLTIYIGPIVLVAASLGGFLWFRPRFVAREPRVMLVACIWILTLAPLLLGFIAELYPWATRRLLPCTVPVAAILAAVPLGALWSQRASRVSWQPLVAVAALLVLVGANSRRAWHAWNATEYGGIAGALAEVSAQIGEHDVVLADHPWWGTPLLLVHHQQVLNGKGFYGRDGATVMAAGLDALTVLQQAGYRVRFLTSTAQGLKVFPRDLPDATLDWSAAPVAIAELIQSRGATDFVLRPREAQFRLYTWRGAAP